MANSKLQQKPGVEKSCEVLITYVSQERAWHIIGTQQEPYFQSKQNKTKKPKENPIISLMTFTLHISENLFYQHVI